MSLFAKRSLLASFRELLHGLQSLPIAVSPEHIIFSLPFSHSRSLGRLLENGLPNSNYVAHSPALTCLGVYDCD